MLVNKGFNGSVVVSCEVLKFCILFNNSLELIDFVSIESRAAPLATNKWASSGIRVVLTQINNLKDPLKMQQFL